MLIDSDNLDHTKETVTIRTYISMILEEIPDEISQVTICSDGPISQFKNKYIAASLEVLKEKYHETIKWNCFAIIHGKGPEDGIGGVLGRQVWQSVLSSKDLVFTASDTATVARHVLEISVIYMTHGGIGFVNKELNIKPVFKKTNRLKEFSKHVPWSARRSCQTLPLKKNKRTKAVSYTHLDVYKRQCESTSHLGTHRERCIYIVLHR